MKLNQKQKSILSTYFPELKPFTEIKDESNSAADSLAIALINKIESVKGEKGDKGDKGDTPKKGVDYLTDDEVKGLIDYVVKLAKPKKGIDYVDGKNGKDGRDGIDGKNGIDGRDGIDGNLIDGKTIAERLNKYKGVLSIDVLEGVASKKELQSQESRILAGMTKIEGRIKATDQRWHGGGLSQVYHDSTLSGTGTSSNPLTVIGGGTWYQDEIVAESTTGTSFSLLHTPTNIVFLYKNGQYLVSGVGRDYTRTGTSITLTDSLLSTDVLTANYS